MACFILLATGLYLAGSNILRLKEHQEMSDWPSMKAVVISSAVVDQKNFRPQIIFQYSRAGQMVIDTLYPELAGFGSKHARNDAASAAVAGFRPGDTIELYYNPEVPSDNRLNTKPPWTVFGQLSLG
ncbi:MAG: DUF3592 domain-containing protein, partial [candidate division Zixibacteria bacterium]